MLGIKKQDVKPLTFMQNSVYLYTESKKVSIKGGYVMQKTIKRRRRMSKKSLKIKKVIFRMAIISSRGQLTVPQDIRTLMHIRKGSVVGFEPTRSGILMKPMKVEPQDPYTEEQWLKIEKLSKNKGKIYKTAEEAKNHIADL